MNVLDPRITCLEMDRRLRAAEQRRRVRLARVDFRPRTCGCGQELDRGRSMFCPRCGSASRAGESVAAALLALG